MKRIFFLLILFFAFIILNAQDFKGGLRFGIDGSQVNGDKLSGFNKLGIIAGGYVNRKFSEKIAVQLEMVYIQKGSRKPTDDNNTFYRMRVNYIELPVSLQYYTSKKFAITGGVSYGVLISSEEADELGVYKYSPPFEKDEFAYQFGLLYWLGENWAFDARYSNSITTIRPYPGGSPTAFFDKGQYNILIEFTLLCRF